MAHIYDLVKKKFKPTDQIQSQYRALYNHKEGFLVLTNNGLSFLEQWGFLEASYHNTLKIPYKMIDKVTTTTGHALELEAKDEKYSFTSLAARANAKVIVQEITEFSKHNGRWSRWLCVLNVE